MMDTTSFKILLKLTAGLLTSMYLLSSVMVVVHPLTVEHETCAEHGELIHTTGGHASHADLFVVEETQAESAFPVVDAAPEHGDGHDHCTLLTFFNQDTTTCAEHHAGWVHTVVLFVPPVVVLSDPIAHSIPQYMLAPKNSPPVV